MRRSSFCAGDGVVPFWFRHHFHLVPIVGKSFCHMPVFHLAFARLELKNLVCRRNRCFFKYLISFDDLVI